MRRRRGVVFLLGAAFLLGVGCGARTTVRSAPPAREVVLARDPIGAGARFLGNAACRACHPGAWDLWRGTAHARSFAALAPADGENPACLRCHATGYGDPRGYRDVVATPDLADVGCEACHGAGAAHALSRYPALVPTGTGGDCPPCEINRICRSCHTAERAADFDLGRDLARVACRTAGVNR